MRKKLSAKAVISRATHKATLYVIARRASTALVDSTVKRRFPDENNKPDTARCNGIGQSKPTGTSLSFCGVFYYPTIGIVCRSICGTGDIFSTVINRAPQCLQMRNRFNPSSISLVYHTRLSSSPQTGQSMLSPFSDSQRFHTTTIITANATTSIAAAACRTAAARIPGALCHSRYSPSGAWRDIQLRRSTHSNQIQRSAICTDRHANHGRQYVASFTRICLSLSPPSCNPCRQSARRSRCK